MTLRIAVIGSGPAAFFAADHLMHRDGLDITVDILERLPVPYGLVRFGVAPDHQKIKSVIKGFAKTAAHERVRFFGNVDVGRTVKLADLQRHYHAVIFATGAQTDRHLGIPGEDLMGSHPATEFVAWYNGHPDFQHCTFDLSGKRVAVVGVGNVAVDIARVLCRTQAELAATDITDAALEAIMASGIEEVAMLGRRGPAEAAFTNPEVRELGELPGADIIVRADEVADEPLTPPDRTTAKKLEILREFAQRAPEGKPKRLAIRFCVSPEALIGDETGHVRAMRVMRNRLELKAGRIVAVPTGQVEEMPVDLVFRSVGYHGVAIADLPFDERSGTVPNHKGRVKGMVGCYVAGWIKRGPSGVIGTNKADASETVEAVCADAPTLPTPPAPDPAAALATLQAACGQLVTWQDWERLDAAEIAAGSPLGRPRVKVVRVADMLGSGAPSAP